ncbi:MAG: tRNA (guanosine(37)-N1)-methyltransferase TrmD [Bacteroidia bacterium]|nr:tRNA (guanosine(37)-N1)-methyltransferase TrmD [Bacteroidia bacterium]MCF8427725.1 tRNA (guanosine(37)-N1)-methyltransferase TrmD [Bacteroidia bacterium]MCF8446365.1 tRNA (guanosine(37)-N1)-methyltransferase TrmD [Bacteroidia bacterium]
MQIDILTLFPQIFEGPFTESILKRAMERGLVQIDLHNIRDYSLSKHKNVDDYPYGGGAGMVMNIEPIDRCLAALKENYTYDEIIYMSPDGEPFTQKIANELSTKKNLVFLCGHYKGVDERVRENLVTRELSLGDFVLTGGELAAATMVDAIVRLLPGALNDETSALSDSFQDDLISPPVYTRPAEYKGWKVPDVLLSGHQAKIDEWRHEQSLVRTKERRPNLGQ